MLTIPFNRPYVGPRELAYVTEAIESRHLARDGAFTQRCEAWLRENTAAQAALLTHSCTAALEMCALLADLAPGDEVIVPSFTFSSTAAAIALRGAVPVFVDVREDTLNLDERLIEAAITPRTRAIFVVHYAGVACEMKAIRAIAERHRLLVIEDAAQALLSTYDDRPVGTLGDLGTLSFHETKNVIAGEGGALLFRDERFFERAAILRDAGTNRRAFLEGKVERYTWVEVGSSYGPGELTAAFLLAQLEDARVVVEARRTLWDRYARALDAAEGAELLRRPVVPPACRHNGHCFYVLTRSPQARTAAIATLRERGIGAVFHYVPLHSSPAGKKAGRTSGAMTVTDSISARLLRLPLWMGMGDSAVDLVAETLVASLRAAG